MSGLWNELLPTSVDIDGTEYEIRSDYRAALDICMAMSDAELDEQDKAFTMLDIFYPSFDDMPAEHYQQAIERCLWFINCGEEETERQHIKLMDWEQDFKYIVAPINRVTGTEIRSIEYMQRIAAHQIIIPIQTPGFSKVLFRPQFGHVFAFFAISAPQALHFTRFLFMMHLPYQDYITISLKLSHEKILKMRWVLWRTAPLP